jgi:hypothetical protein
MGKKILGFDTDKAWDYENGFYLTSHVTRIAKLVAHYELYKSIVDLPGEIVECGVYKGASLIRFATFREILESPYSRRIVGFDAFGAFPKPSDDLDAAFVSRFESAGGPGIDVEQLTSALGYKSLDNVELIPGDILATVPQYIDRHPELKVALLHLDADVYNASLTALNCLYDRVVPGGVVVLDDFGKVAGETRAIDEFFHGKNVVFKKLPLAHIPTYVRKP